ncbi:hypothetical protein [Bacteroides sp.]
MIRNKIHKICIFLQLLWLGACSPYPSDVESALQLAGGNRSELIKVLNHYKGHDKLKYKAACFLISNMPYHESEIELEISSDYLEYFQNIDSICNSDSTAIKNDSLKRVLAKAFDSIPYPQEKESKTDIQLITADFLIDNIEQAFESWHNSPLLKSLSFNEFKEWILPYRTADEALTDDKRLLNSFIYNRISVNGMDDIHKTIDSYIRYVRLQKEMNKYVTSKRHIGSFDLFIPAFIMDCHNLAARTSNLFRACGIPVTYEFTPQWPDKDSKHYWCASPDSNHILQPYTPPYNNLREDWNWNLKYTGKVYQRTFSALKDTPYFLKEKHEYVPSPLNIPTIKDVTDRYHSCITLTLPITENIPNNLAYLAFFNTEKEIAAVAWGKIDKRRHIVTFKQVPINMLFFPVYTSGDGVMHHFHHPFILRNDSINRKIIKEDICYDKTQLTNMHLLRKYPSKRLLKSYRKTLQGACLLGAQQWNGPYDTLLSIKNIPEPYWQEYCTDNKSKYRYYRFQPRNGQPMDIAEFEFLGKDDSKHKYVEPTPLPIFSPNIRQVDTEKCKKVCGEPMKTGPFYFHFYDNNPESFARWGFLGMDFKEPICISKIRLLPRTAINIVEPNYHYQLLYFNGKEWIEHKTIISKYNFIDVDSVPKNTIYWLRNLDKGKEELPFFYEQGKQVFINQYL